MAFIAILGVSAITLIYRDGDPNTKMFEPQMLALFNGERGAPLYMAILGEVFDVSRSPKHYGKGAGYGHFVGRDASRAFVTGEFKTDLTDNISGFTPEQCATLMHWRGFYRKHKVYKYKGRVHGAFYNDKLEPLGPVKHVERKAAVAKTAEQAQRELEAKYPPCNVRWSEASGGFVWCDGGHFPRKIFTQLSTGQPTTRCACFGDFGWSDIRQIYPGCEPQDTECRTLPPGPAVQEHSEL